VQFPERLAVTADRPRAVEDKEALSACGMALPSHPLFAVPPSSGRTGPSCGEQRAKRAWLPALLVWTWVRSYRRLLAGNARLRPATTNFSRLRRSIECGQCVMQRPRKERLRPLPLPVYTCRSNGLRTCRTRPALIQLSVKKRRKLHCRLLDNVPETKQSGTSAQRRRCGESARTFTVAFRRKLRRSRSA
jgi:hypothetical protein